MGLCFVFVALYSGLYASDEWRLCISVYVLSDRGQEGDQEDTLFTFKIKITEILKLPSH